jgi:hypothetical protein
VLLPLKLAQQELDNKKGRPFGRPFYICKICVSRRIRFNPWFSYY